MGCCAIENDKIENPRIKQLGRENRDYKVIPAKFPLHSWNLRKKIRNQKIGFGLEFAREYEKNILAENRKVLIINSAMGGTGFINEGGWSEGEVLYEDAISRVLYSLRLGAQDGFENRVVAVLWQQGEHDASEDNLYYYWNLKRFVRSFRSDMGGDYFIIPFYLGLPVETWRDGGVVTHRHLRKKIKKVARELKATYVVPTAGLKSNKSEGTGNDEVHFSANAQRELGRRYFEVFKMTN